MIRHCLRLSRARRHTRMSRSRRCLHLNRQLRLLTRCRYLHQCLLHRHLMSIHLPTNPYKVICRVSLKNSHICYRQYPNCYQGNNYYLWKFQF
jgi:hypothetical protein